MDLAQVLDVSPKVERVWFRRIANSLGSGSRRRGRRGRSVVFIYICAGRPLIHDGVIERRSKRCSRGSSVVLAKDRSLARLERLKDDTTAVVFKPAGIHTKAGSNPKFAALEDALTAELSPPVEADDALPLPMVMHRCGPAWPVTPCSGGCNPV